MKEKGIAEPVAIGFRLKYSYIVIFRTSCNSSVSSHVRVGSSTLYNIA